MHNLKNKKKNNIIVTAATLFTLATVVFATTTIMTPSAQGSRSEDRFINPTTNLRSEPKAPMAVSQDGDNVYIVWWTNKSEIGM